MKCLYRPRSQHGVRRSQVNQIITVNNQRPQPQFPAPPPKSRRIRFRNARSSLGPTSAGSTKISAARSRPVRARFPARLQHRLRWTYESLIRRLPSFHAGISRWRKRLGTILIGGVERQLDSMVVCRHSLRLSGDYNHHFSRTVTTAQTRAHTRVAQRAAAQISLTLQASRSARYSFGAGASAGFFAPPADFPPIIGLGFQ